VSIGMHVIYITGLSVFLGGWNYYREFMDYSREKKIHVVGSCEKREVGLYVKYDYYLIYNKKLVRSCGVTSIVSVLNIQLTYHEHSLCVRDSCCGVVVKPMGILSRQDFLLRFVP
jgi:hypothetical protein